jgi:hypothetical protein
MLLRNTKCNLRNSKFRIELTNELPVFTKQYLIQERMSGKVVEKVKKWISNEWVEEVKGKSNGWNSLLFAAPKIFGGERVKEEIRLCIDFRQVNEKTKSIMYTTPNSRQYMWCRMSFGLKGAPTHFQQVAEQVVGETMEFTRMYVDNFLIYSKLVKEHIEHLLIVIQSLTKAGFRLNVEKCRLGYKKMKFIGNIINSETKTLEKKKVESIQEIQRLKSGKQVESFLGLVNILRDYILIYSDLVGPLERLLKWKRIEECDDTLKKIKEVIGMTLVLHHPDWEKKFIVAINAVGAMLYQVINGKKKYVEFAAKSLIGGQKNYFSVKKELLAIIYILKK